MAKAIEKGLPKLRIEEAAAKTQARIDSGRQTVIGVNKYKPTDERPIDVLRETCEAETGLPAELGDAAPVDDDLPVRGRVATFAAGAGISRLGERRRGGDERQSRRTVSNHRRPPLLRGAECE